MGIILFFTIYHYPDWYKEFKQALEDTLQFPEVPETLLCILPSINVLDSNVLVASWYEVSEEPKWRYNFSVLNNSTSIETLLIAVYKGELHPYNPLLPGGGQCLRILSDTFLVYLDSFRVYTKRIERNQESLIGCCENSITIFLKRRRKWKLVFDDCIWAYPSKLEDLNLRGKVSKTKIDVFDIGIFRYRNCILNSGGKEKVVYYFLYPFRTWEDSLIEIKIEDSITIKIEEYPRNKVKIVYPPNKKILLTRDTPLDSLIVWYRMPRVIKPVLVQYKIKAEREKPMSPFYIESPKFIVFPHRRKILFLRDKIFLGTVRLLNLTKENLIRIILCSRFPFNSPIACFLISCLISFLVGYGIMRIRRKR